MYNKKISKLLKDLSINIGDRIGFVLNNKTYQGILLPKSKSSLDSTLVIKLDSGYNIGVDINNITKIYKISEGIKMQKDTDSNLLVDSDKKDFRDKIAILGCGGTIACQVDYISGAVHPQFSTNDLLEIFPQVKKFGNIKAKSVFNILSENMTPLHWQKIALEVYNAFKDGANSAVILHGTDTLGYSAAALTYALEGLQLPVILSGAQRSSDRPSSDAKQNFLCSVAAAASDIAGVYVCMHASTNDDFNYLHLGTRVRKAHTSKRAAFRSIGYPPIAKIYANDFKIEFNNLVQIPKRGENKINLKNKFSENVHLAWVYPGISKKEIKHWYDYDGIVLAGTGLGHFPTSSSDFDKTNELLAELKELIQSGVLVVMAPQAGEGRIVLTTYSTGRLLEEIGVIGNGCDWLLETAYVKLCWALGQTKNKNKVKELLLQPIANDITSYSIVTQEQESEG